MVRLCRTVTITSQALPIIRKLEQDYSLEAVTPSWETYRRAPTQAELKEFDRFGVDSVRLTIAALAREAAASSPTMPEYIDRMKDLGVEVRVNITFLGGFIRGLSYAMNGYAFQGSDVGKDYSWRGLQQYLGVSYVQSRDFEAIGANPSRTSNSTGQAKRTSERVERGDRPSESADPVATAADRQSSQGLLRIETALSHLDRSASDLAESIGQTDPGKLRIETAASQLDRSAEQLAAAASHLDRGTGNLAASISATQPPAQHSGEEQPGTSSRFSRLAEDVFGSIDAKSVRLRKRTDNRPAVSLAAAPIGAGDESRAAREYPAAATIRHNIAAQLDQIGAAVERLNADFEPEVQPVRAAGNDGRTESGAARSALSRTSPDASRLAAEIQRQFDEINLIHENIRRKRRTELEQLDAELTSKTIAPRVSADFRPGEVTLTEEQKVNGSVTFLDSTRHSVPQKPEQESYHNIRNEVKQEESVDDCQLQEEPQPTNTKPVNNPRARRIASLIPLVGSTGKPKQSDTGRTSKDKSEDRGISDRESLFARIDEPIRTAKSNREGAQANQPDSKQADRRTRSASPESRAIEPSHDSELEKLTARQAAAARRIRELEAEHQRLEAERLRQLEAERQQPSSRSKQPNNTNQHRHSPSRKNKDSGIEL